MKALRLRAKSIIEKLSGRLRPEKGREAAVKSSFRAVLGRAPSRREGNLFSRRLDSGELNMESFLHELLDSPEYVSDVSGLCKDDWWRAPGGSREKALRLRQGPVEMKEFSALLDRLLPAEEDMVIGQKEYVRAHKRRFLELANAVLLLAPKGEKILEFGVSEFSRVYKELLPGCSLVTADRPVADDFPGFTGERSRRVSGCDVHIAVDLEEEDSSGLKKLASHGPFDLVLFTEVLEHLLAEPVALIQNLLRLLSRRGLLYLSTPNFFRGANHQALAALRNPQPFYPGHAANWDAHHHHREYSMTELLELIRLAGGRVISCHFSDCWDDPKERGSGVRADRKTGLVVTACAR